jgi:hypothetical protein
MQILIRRPTSGVRQLIIEEQGFTEQLQVEKQLRLVAVTC